MSLQQLSNAEIVRLLLAWLTSTYSASGVSMGRSTRDNLVFFALRIGDWPSVSPIYVEHKCEGQYNHPFDYEDLEAEAKRRSGSCPRQAFLFDATTARVESVSDTMICWGALHHLLLWYREDAKGRGPGETLWVEAGIAEAIMKLCLVVLPKDFFDLPTLIYEAKDRNDLMVDLELEQLLPPMLD